jgi:hypothetical protein
MFKDERFEKIYHDAELLNNMENCYNSRIPVKII